MKPFFKKVGEIFFKTYLTFVLVWVFTALSFQVYMVYLEFSGQDEKINKVVNELTIRVDGRYKDNPKNIFYENK